MSERPVSLGIMGYPLKHHKNIVPRDVRVPSLYQEMLVSWSANVNFCRLGVVEYIVLCYLCSLVLRKGF